MLAEAEESFDFWEFEKSQRMQGNVHPAGSYMPIWILKRLRGELSFLLICKLLYVQACSSSFCDLFQANFEFHKIFRHLFAH